MLTCKIQISQGRVVVAQALRRDVVQPHFADGRIVNFLALALAGTQQAGPAAIVQSKWSSITNSIHTMAFTFPSGGAMDTRGWSSKTSHRMAAAEQKQVANAAGLCQRTPIMFMSWCS